VSEREEQAVACIMFPVPMVMPMLATMKAVWARAI
jgi:hypothetical protein